MIFISLMLCMILIKELKKLVDLFKSSLFLSTFLNPMKKVFAVTRLIFEITNIFKVRFFHDYS